MTELYELYYVDGGWKRNDLNEWDGYNEEEYGKWYDPDSPISNDEMWAAGAHPKVVGFYQQGVVEKLYQNMITNATGYFEEDGVPRVKDAQFLNNFYELGEGVVLIFPCKRISHLYILFYHNLLIQDQY